MAWWPRPGRSRFANPSRKGSGCRSSLAPGQQARPQPTRPKLHPAGQRRLRGELRRSAFRASGHRGARRAPARPAQARQDQAPRCGRSGPSCDPARAQGSPADIKPRIDASSVLLSMMLPFAWLARNGSSACREDSHSLEPAEGAAPAFRPCVRRYMTPPPAETPARVGAHGERACAAAAPSACAPVTAGRRCCTRSAPDHQAGPTIQDGSCATPHDTRPTQADPTERSRSRAGLEPSLAPRFLALLSCGPEKSTQRLR